MTVKPTVFAINKRAAYRSMFNALTIPLKNIDQILGDITFQRVLELNVEYDMTMGQVSGLVIFVFDDDGIWRLKFV